MQPQKRNNKGLVTFDKRQYFPMCFIEQIAYPGANGGNERESKTDKRQTLKKSEHGKKPVVVQALDEDDDNEMDINNEEEEPGIIARDLDRELHTGT